jgi:hypothetical protein
MTPDITRPADSKNFHVINLVRENLKGQAHHTVGLIDLLGAFFSAAPKKTGLFGAALPLRPRPPGVARFAPPAIPGAAHGRTAASFLYTGNVQF